jgi:ABC-2 type transport system permease protein
MLWQTIKRNYKLPLFLGIGLSLIATLFATLFHDYQDQLGAFANMIPEAMRAIIGDIMLGSKPEGWLALELFPLFVMVGMSVIGVVLGASVIGREEDSGTLELLLASRRSRVVIVLQKYLALAKLLAIPSLLLFIAIALCGPIFNFHPSIPNVLTACASAWLLGLGFGSMAFAAQAVTGRRGLAIGVGSGIFLAMYALTIASKLIDSWKDYDDWSLIHYYNIPGSLIDGLDVAKLFVLIFVSFIMLGIAVIGFRRRDTGV